MRERGALPLAAAIRELTSEPASVRGIPRRGLGQPGSHADLNPIDLARLDLALPEVRRDLPGGDRPLAARGRVLRNAVVATQ